MGTMKISRIERDVAVEHTWDITTKNEQYVMSNGCISHNTSSQIINATNGVEPPRSFVTVKQSKDGSLTQVVPEYRRLKNKYELLWDQPSPRGYLNIMAVLQKYIDQSISTNTSYNPQQYEDDQIPMSVLLSDLMHSYKMGIKTLYYCNIYDGQGELDINDDTNTDETTSDSTPVVEEESCSSCVL